MSSAAAATAPTTSACLIASSYNTSAFSWSKDTQTFAAEASSLGWRPGSFARHIWLTSTKTGDRRLFSIKGTDRDNGGDVTGWRFQDSTGLNMLVIND